MEEVVNLFLKYKENIELTNQTIEKLNQYNSEPYKLDSETNSCITEFINLLNEEKEDWIDLSFTIDEWNLYNDQFKEYFKKRTEYINTKLYYFSKIEFSQLSYDNTMDNMIEFENFLRNGSFHLFINFRYGNYNYILFGKNGCGKTSLLNQLSSSIINNNIIIKATRNIGYNFNLSFRPTDCNLVTALNCNEDCRSLTLLSRCVINKEIEERRNAIEEKNIITNMVKMIFNSLGLERKLIINVDGELFLENDKNKSYSLYAGSDGERTIVYLIMSILLTPKNYFVFIDEPENHLNTALLIKLFDMLENYRKDLKFVYASHNVAFVESRKNIQLINLKKTSDKNKFKFYKMQKFENISFNTIASIEGINDDVMFCEGNSISSYDYKLYSTLFPNRLIKMIGGCDQVISHTKTINEYKNIFRRKAYGIVDNDFRTESDVTELHNKNVYVLKVNEVENLFMLTSCIESFSNIVEIQNDIKIIKSKIINDIVNKKDAILRDFAIKSYRKLERKNRFENIESIEEELKRINEYNDSKFLTNFRQYKQNLDESISNNDYDALMILVPGKQLKSIFSELIGINFDVYVNTLLKEIAKNSMLNEELKRYIEQ